MTMPLAFVNLADLRVLTPAGSPIVHIKDHQRGTLVGPYRGDEASVTWDTDQTTEEPTKNLALVLDAPTPEFPVDGADIAVWMLAQAESTYEVRKDLLWSAHAVTGFYLLEVGVPEDESPYWPWMWQMSNPGGPSPSGREILALMLKHCLGTAPVSDTAKCDVCGGKGHDMFRQPCGACRATGEVFTGDALRAQVARLQAQVDTAAEDRAKLKALMDLVPDEDPTPRVLVEAACLLIKDFHAICELFPGKGPLLEQVQKLVAERARLIEMMPEAFREGMRCEGRGEPRSWDESDAHDEVRDMTSLPPDGTLHE